MEGRIKLLLDRAKYPVLSWRNGCCAQGTEGSSGDRDNNDRDPAEPGTRSSMVDQSCVGQETPRDISSPASSSNQGWAEPQKRW